MTMEYRPVDAVSFRGALKRMARMEMYLRARRDKMREEKWENEARNYWEGAQEREAERGMIEQALQIVLSYQWPPSIISPDEIENEIEAAIRFMHDHASEIEKEESP